MRIFYLLVFTAAFIYQPDLQAQQFDLIYQEPVFDSIERATFVYAVKGDDSLAIDIYTPSADTTEARPLLLYVHGGGFSGGRRDEPGQVAFAEALARRGYLVASMSYRLTMKGQSFHCDQPAANKVRTFQLVVEDIRDATNFLIDRSDNLRLATEQIVLAGSSAGAEAVLHAAYWRDQDLLEDSPGLPAGFRYAGVIGMAGALVDRNLIDADSAIPTQLFHGTCDPLVPYDSAPHHYCSEEDTGYLMLDGSFAIMERLRELGRPHFLVTSCNGGHEWAGRPLRNHVEEITDFLYQDVLKGAFRQIHLRLMQDGDCDLIETPVFCK